jgi:putative ABC transport system ATP-binding protein
VLIEFLNVTKIYDLPSGQVRALHNVTLKVAEGEFIAIMGPSGSGKSTMMNLLGLLDRPTRGRYLLEGDDVGSRSDHELALLRRHKIGFIFQSFNLLPRVSALKNVALPLMYAGVRPREREERARAMLARVGLSDRGHHKPPELSGGQQQRAAIARALVNTPRLVLADEPTGNLDSATGRDVLALLQELNAQGVTIVVITHDAQVAQHARRVVRLLDGVVVEDRSINGKAGGALLKRRAG